MKSAVREPSAVPPPTAARPDDPHGLTFVRAEAGQPLPTRAYRGPLLVALVLMGGSAALRDAYHVMMEAMADWGLLTPADFERTPSSVMPKAYEYTRSQLTTMIRTGLLEAHPNGVYAATESGEEASAGYLAMRDDSLDALRERQTVERGAATAEALARRRLRGLRHSGAAALAVA